MKRGAGGRFILVRGAIRMDPLKRVQRETRTRPARRRDADGRAETRKSEREGWGKMCGVVVSQGDRAVSILNVQSNGIVFFFFPPFYQSDARWWFYVEDTFDRGRGNEMNYRAHWEGVKQCCHSIIFAKG